MAELIREAQRRASSFLQKHNIIDADNQAEIMLMAINNWDRSRLLLNWQAELPPDGERLLQSWLDRRVLGEPLQYIIGEQDFYGRSFQVSPDVLIPRPETEILVEAVIKEADLFLAGAVSVVAADIGTGSGAIGITLALERTNWQLYLLDISSKAIEAATANARMLNAQMDFFQGDLLTPLIEKQIKVDLLISNPPYIPTQDVFHLMTEVREYEPLLALDGGEDGIDFYRQIIRQSKQVLNSRSMLCFELGIGQSVDVIRLLKEAGADNYKVIKDLQGIDRVIIAFFI